MTFARNAVAGSLPAGPVVSVAYTTQVFAKLGAGKRLIAAVLVLAAGYSGGRSGCWRWWRWSSRRRPG